MTFFFFLCLLPKQKLENVCFLSLFVQLSLIGFIYFSYSSSVGKQMSVFLLFRISAFVFISDRFFDFLFFSFFRKFLQFFFENLANLNHVSGCQDSTWALFSSLEKSDFLQSSAFFSGSVWMTFQRQTVQNRNLCVWLEYPFRGWKQWEQKDLMEILLSRFSRNPPPVNYLSYLRLSGVQLLG